MDKEMELEARFLVINQVLAFLLARESVVAKSSVSNFGNALKEQITATIAKSSETIAEKTNIRNEDLANFSKIVSSEIESIFGMAEAYYSVMPDK